MTKRAIVKAMASVIFVANLLPISFPSAARNTLDVDRNGIGQFDTSILWSEPSVARRIALWSKFSANGSVWNIWLLNQAIIVSFSLIERPIKYRVFVRTRSSSPNCKICSWIFSGNSFNEAASFDNLRYSDMKLKI